MHQKSSTVALALCAALILAACSGAKTPTAATPAPQASAPAAPAKSKSEDSEPRIDTEVALERLAQMPAQDRLPGGRWQAGKNYTVLVPAQPTNVGPGKIEVIEVFWYGCPHCYELDTYLESR